MNLNSCVIGGNCTRDNELRYTPSGAAVAECGLAINRVWYNDKKEKQEATTFVDVVAWGKTAEILCQYVKKGDPVMFEGELESDLWEDKATGQKRSKLRVKATRLHLVGGKRATVQQGGVAVEEIEPPF